MKQLNIGVLGAARISPEAIIEPARITGTTLVAVAARDKKRAKAFADEHGIKRVVDSYQALIDDPEVEAIYNPLPNGLHGPWNLKAIAAGKHVLTEKPSASNADEAKKVVKALKNSPLVFMEGFHYRYHPVMQRMMQLATSGEIGEVHHVDVQMGFPINDLTDPRLSFELAGGAMMDVGCYAVHALRTLGEFFGGEPTLDVVDATERTDAKGIDNHVDADLTYPSGVTAHFGTGFDFPGMQFTLRLEGTHGVAHAHNFVKPHMDNRIQIVRGGVGHYEHHGDQSTYTYQLEAFTDAVRNGSSLPTDQDDALNQAAFIDKVYEAAGMPLRPTSKA